MNAVISYTSDYHGLMRFFHTSAGRGVTPRRLFASAVVLYIFEDLNYIIPMATLSYLVPRRGNA
jgi:hypothetical protein